VFQARTLDLDLTFCKPVLSRGAARMSAQETKLRAGFVLDQVAMTGRAHDKARDLSGGQIRRVEIARALLHQPRMLLLDEPTVGLDVKVRAIFSNMSGLVANESIGVLWATHLIDEIEPATMSSCCMRARLSIAAMREVAARAGTPDIAAAFKRLTGMPAREHHGSAVMAKPHGEGFRLAQYARCFKGIVWRESLRYWHQRERLSRFGAPARLAVHLRFGISLGLACRSSRPMIPMCSMTSISRRGSWR